jgi:hypothetical protein
MDALPTSKISNTIHGTNVSLTKEISSSTNTATRKIDNTIDLHVIPSFGRSPSNFSIYFDVNKLRQNSKSPAYRTKGCQKKKYNIRTH